MLLQEITAWKKDDETALSVDDNGAWMVSHNSNHRHTRTTTGWLLEVQWKGGVTTWIPLEDLKESHPLQVAELAVAQHLLEEPAFAWWASAALASRDRMISAVKARFHMKTHKYGICAPCYIKEAMEIDARTGTDLWKKK